MEDTLAFLPTSSSTLRLEERTSTALSFLDPPNSKTLSHNTYLPSDALHSKASSQTAVLHSTVSAGPRPQSRRQPPPAPRIDGDTLPLSKMSSPRKNRSSGEVDPYSAAHIYYGNEVYHTSTNLSRTRTYSTTVSILPLLPSVWPAANGINL